MAATLACGAIAVGPSGREDSWPQHSLAYDTAAPARLASPIRPAGARRHARPERADGARRAAHGGFDAVVATARVAVVARPW